MSPLACHTKRETWDSQDLNKACESHLNSNLVELIATPLHACLQDFKEPLVPLQSWIADQSLSDRPADTHQ